MGFTTCDDDNREPAIANRNGPSPGNATEITTEMGDKQGKCGSFSSTSFETSSAEDSGDGASNLFAGIQDEAVQDTPAEQAAGSFIGSLPFGLNTVKAEVQPVFFMIGCQRSGSNWLRTMLGEREDLIAPHPPHIMRDFSPLLQKYGDLNKQPNLKVSEFLSLNSSHSLDRLKQSVCSPLSYLEHSRHVVQILIDHVCAMVEKNQVQWVDLHGRPVRFNRFAILAEVMISLECLACKLRFEAIDSNECGTTRESAHEFQIEDTRFHLLAIFDAIMNTMAAVNSKKIWMCKSMGMVSLSLHGAISRRSYNSFLPIIEQLS